MRKFIFRLLGGFAIFSALVFFAVAIFLFQRTRSFLSGAVRADARVIRLIEKHDFNSGPHYYPVFSFHDSSGEEHEIFSSSGSFPPANAVGDSVTVFYHTQQPSKAREDSFSELWLIPVILAAVGLFDLTLGLAFIFVPMLYQKLKREPPEKRLEPVMHFAGREN